MTLKDLVSFHRSKRGANYGASCHNRVDGVGYIRISLLLSVASPPSFKSFAL